MAGEEGAKPSSDKAKKFDTSFKKAVGGSLKLKGVEFKGYRSLQAAACASVCGSRPAAAARAAAACCRVRRLNRATVRSKKAIVTKKEAAKGDTGSHGAGVDEHKMPGGVRKISNGTVSGRGVGAMSYDPQVRSVCIPPHHHHHRLPHTVPLCDGTQRRWRSTDVFALSNPRARRQTWTSVSSKRATASACTHDASPGNASRTHRSWYMATGWRNHGALRLPVARNRSHLSGGL